MLADPVRQAIKTNMAKEKNFTIWYKRRRRFLALVTFFVVVVVWVGWISGIPLLKTGLPGFPPMSPLAALAAALLAIIIFQPPRIPKSLFMAMAIGVGTGSCILLIFSLWPEGSMPLVIKYFVDGPAGIKNYFAPLTPLCFFALSIAAGLQLNNRLYRFRESVIVGTFFLMYLIFIGHVSHAEYVQSFSFFANVSLPAEITIFLVSLGLLYKENGQGIMSLLSSDTEGGSVARELLVAVIIFPAITTYFILLGVSAGAYQHTLATALNIVVNVFFFEVFVWRIGNRLQLSEIARIRAEQQVIQRQRELETFQRAVDASTEGVIMTDATGAIWYVNTAWEALTGWKLSEVKGKNPRLLKSGKTSSSVYRRMWKTLISGKSFRTEEIFNIRKDTTEYNADLRVFPIGRTAKDLVYVGIEQDITERKAIELAKTEFVSIASHQLRTPLTAVNWYTEMLLNGDAGQLSKKQKTFIQEVADGSQRMTALVNALLNVARIEAGTFSVTPERLALQELIATVFKENLPSILKRHLKVNVKISRTVPRISVDRQLMYIIVQNLLTNAIKYTPQKGTITIGLIQNRKNVVFKVADTGYGIPKAQQKNIYQKMYRAENIRSKVPDGTGLGLYVVKSILDHTGGSISFVSAEGKGTTFSVTLPMSGMSARQGTKTLIA